MSFPAGVVNIPIGQEKVTTTTQRRRLGTRGVSEDGNAIYRYARNSVAIEGGKLVQSAATIGASSNVAALATVTASSGATTVQVIPQHASTSQSYIDGYLTVGTTPAVAVYRIASQPTAFTSGAAATIQLHPHDELRQAWTSGTTTVGLRQNLYLNVIVAPATTLTGAIVGCTTAAMAANTYGWIQTWGPAMLNVDAALIAGLPIVYGGASAGNGTPATTVVQDVVAPVVAWALTAGAGADTNGLVFLRISP